VATIANKKSEPSENGEKIFTVSDINRIIHEPARLLIVSLLYVVEESDFVFLRTQTNLTDGNLSSHLSKLENEGYVNAEKLHKGKKTQTRLSLTEAGRKAFENYRKKMSEVLNP
jgi:DNA-binding MarR family transcriptional regulator